jgi:RNA polymerase primary sigma factor
MTKNIDIYMKEIRDLNHLSLKEEKELFVAYKEQGSRKAYNKILNSNTKFVLKMAFHYKKATQYDLGDLIGAGNLGMLLAIQTFKYQNPGMRFSQWAVYKIRSEMLTEIASQSGFVAIHANEALSNKKLIDIGKKLRQSLGREATDEELAIASEIKPKHVAHMKSVLAPQASLDAPVSESNNLHQVLAAAKEEGENSELTERISKVLNLSGLDDLHKDVVRMYFGIGYQMSYCLQEIADKYDRSREGIRVIKKRALNQVIEFNLDQKVDSDLVLTMELIHA